MAQDQTMLAMSGSTSGFMHDLIEVDFTLFCFQHFFRVGHGVVGIGLVSLFQLVTCEVWR